MSLLAAPSGKVILTALALIVTVAVVVTITITRCLVPRWRNMCREWPQLGPNFADSDSRWLRAGMLVFSSAVAAGAIAGLITALGTRQISMVWFFCWCGGIAVARFLFRARVAGILSGIAMGALALAWALHTYYQNGPARLNPVTDVIGLGVLASAFGFGLGYGLSASIGCIHRCTRWLWLRWSNHRRP